MRYIPKFNWVIYWSVGVVVLGAVAWWVITSGDANRVIEFGLYSGAISIGLGFLSLAGSSEGWYSEHYYSIEGQHEKISEMKIGPPFALIPVWGGGSAPPYLLFMDCANNIK
ncbi:MAG: hypothetical protein GY820_19480 [Gammaproteobacteria bacterium]|nr:hypothetical protein [Gammaproteobacteria bacterium]